MKTYQLTVLAPEQLTLPSHSQYTTIAATIAQAESRVLKHVRALTREKVRVILAREVEGDLVR